MIVYCIQGILLTLFIFPCCTANIANKQDIKARKWLDTKFYPTFNRMKKISTVDDFDYEANMTKVMRNETITTTLKLSKFQIKAAHTVYSRFNNLKVFRNGKIRREIMFLAMLGSDSSEKEREQEAQWQGDLTELYSTASICPINNPINCSKSERLVGDPDLNLIMANSKNETLLRYVWEAWRDCTGPKMADKFHKIVNLSNVLVRRIGYESLANKWIKDYTIDDPTFKKSLQLLWRDTLPLYEQLHAYVRYKLHQKYGKMVDLKSEIPAHLLGNMWAQSWENIFDIVMPYPNAPENLNITASLQKGNWSINRMFRAAENFFKSIGFRALPKVFWEKSVFSRTEGVNMTCHASAWDLADKDVRIKMCTKIDNEDFGVIHHELGHIYYYLAYDVQRPMLRAGANSGFHEAVGDSLFLSADSPKYLEHLGLLKPSRNKTKEGRINRLMKKALSPIALLPWTYVVDLWRWDVFDQKVPENKQNERWWQLRRKYQGVKPPRPRKPTDLDPLSKYHVANFVPYVRYFVARILQFQFHKSLCLKADKTNLETCTIYGSKAAGRKFWHMLSLGRSKPWPVALKILTGTKNMTAKPLLEFYQELYIWLKKENERNGQCLGWGAKWPAYFKLKGKRCA